MAIDPSTIPVGQEALYETVNRIDYHARRVSETELSWRVASPSLDTALATNATYLARSAPTAAQNTAQIQHLTQMMSAVCEVVMDSVRRESFPR